MSMKVLLQGHLFFELEKECSWQDVARVHASLEVYAGSERQAVVAGRSSGGAAPACG